MFPLTPDQHHWLEVATEDEGLRGVFEMIPLIFMMSMDDTHQLAHEQDTDIVFLTYFDFCDHSWLTVNMITALKSLGGYPH